MRSNLAYDDDRLYDEVTTSSVFSRQMRRPLPRQAPRVNDYSISGAQVTSFDEAFRQSRIEIIDSANGDLDLLNTIAKSINELLLLEPDWDSYGGLPTSEVAARKAIRIVSGIVAQSARLPAIVPVNDGGIQLEWHNNGWDVEIEVHPDGAVSTFIDNGSISNTWRNHQLPQDRQFIEALAAVTMAS